MPTPLLVNQMMREGLEARKRAQSQLETAKVSVRVFYVEPSCIEFMKSQNEF